MTSQIKISKSDFIEIINNLQEYYQFEHKLYQLGLSLCEANDKIHRTIELLLDQLLPVNALEYCIYEYLFDQGKNKDFEIYVDDIKYIAKDADELYDIMVKIWGDKPEVEP